MALPRLLLLALLLLLLTAGAASGQRATPRADEVPLADLVEIVVLERQLLAVDATAGDATLALQLGERVLWTGTRGRVGVVLTDERVLAFASGTGGWRELRLLRAERLPAGALLGDRVALVLTSQRAIGFDAGAGRLAEYRLGPREAARFSRAAENVAVVVTDRAALGLSSDAGGFFSSALQAREEIRSLDVQANVALLRTGRRLLTFRGPTGSWSERRLDLADRDG